MGVKGFCICFKTVSFVVGVVSQYGKLLPLMAVSPNGVLVQVQGALLPIGIPANVPGEGAEDGPSATGCSHPCVRAR